MNVTVLEGGIRPQIHKGKATSILEKTLQAEGTSDAEVSIIFEGDESLRKLKQEFFDKDEYTDVIAFRLNDYSEEKVEGEIYISTERAKDNADSFGEPFEKETARLIIHGGLHLLDYNDESDEEKEVMRTKENQYLDSLGWEGLIND